MVIGLRRAVIFSNGEYRHAAGVLSRLSSEDYLICADGALARLRELELVPDLVVGDMDSASASLIDQAAAQGVEILRVPAEKDFTDTEMALREAVGRGYAQVLVLGAWGGRIDHSLGNLLLFPPFIDAGTDVTLSDGSTDAYYVKEELQLDGCLGRIVSLLPLTPVVKGVTIDGFQYPLQGATLRWGKTLGVSNIAISDKISIHLSEGMLLAVLTDILADC